jgi:putative heme-binding domain-containing protein
MGLIRTALADSDPTVQQAAVRSSGVLRDRRAVGQLIELLGSDELPRRRAAATALGQIGDSAAVVPLLAALALGGDVHLQHALVYALIEIGDFESTLAGLAAVSPQVQHAALVALDQIDPSRLTQQHVAPLLQSDDAILRRAALAIVTAREGWSDQIISFLDGWVGANDDPAQVELAHAAILTFAGDVRVQQMIKRALASPATSDEVREELLVALGRLRPLPEAWIAPLNKLLKSQRDTWQLKVIACIAASGTTALNEQLGVLGRDPATSESVRLAAWLCLAEGGAALPREPFARLVQQVSAASDPLDRLTAARALARAALARDQLEQLVDLLPRMGSLELPALVEAIGRSSLIGQDPPLSLRFVRALDRSTATSALAPDQLERILQSLPGQVQVQAEAVRAKVRASDQEIIQHLQHVMRTLSDGDVERGRGVFFSNRAACSACHAVEGSGGNIGPDLSHIGKIRARSDLLEAILFPSASIVNSFETYAVATTDGRIVQGILQRADNRWLALRDAQRNEIVISRDDVETLQRQSGSIMPQGLVDDLSSDQLADLLAYLESLGVSH